MAKGFKHGGGAAAAPLNFKVVGGTNRPSAPGENTIWVNTATEISSWVLSPEEPEAAEGMVWVAVGAASECAFNALKKNALMVFPLSAKIFTGGAWETAEASIYQGGLWKQLSRSWDGYYFKDGDQYESVTGGWTTEGWDNQAAANADNGILYVESPSQLYYARIGTANAVDLTGVNRIWVDSPAGKGNSFYPGYLLVCTEKQDFTNVAQLTISEAGTASVDVAGLNGPHYLLLRTLGGQSGAGSAGIRALWAE